LNSHISPLLLITCENEKMFINGILGININIAHINIIPTYKPWNTDASLKTFEIHVSNPRIS